MSERNPLDALDRLHPCFETEGVEYWLFGGWAVDFHAGTVTRPHGDLDLAIWLRDLPRVATPLRRECWTHEPEGAKNGSTAFTRGAVRVELAFLERDGADGEPYTPLANGDRATRAGGGEKGARVPQPGIPWLPSQGSALEATDDVPAGAPAPAASRSARRCGRGRCRPLACRSPRGSSP